MLETPIIITKPMNFIVSPSIKLANFMLTYRKRPLLTPQNDLQGALPKLTNLQIDLNFPTNSPKITLQLKSLKSSAFKVINASII